VDVMETSPSTVSSTVSSGRRHKAVGTRPGRVALVDLERSLAVAQLSGIAQVGVKVVSVVHSCQERVRSVTLVLFLTQKRL